MNLFSHLQQKLFWSFLKFAKSKNFFNNLLMISALMSSKYSYLDNNMP